MGNTLRETDVETTTNNTDGGSTRSREEVLLDPLMRAAPGMTKPTTGTDDPPDVSNLTGGLKLALGGDGDTAQSIADTLRPRLKKVTDPVAFMTSAKLDGRGRIQYGEGNYDKAIADLGSEDGFYEQAKAECDSLIAEMTAALVSGTVSRAESTGFNNMITFVEQYKALYESLQVTGNVYVWNKKAGEATEAVKSQIGSAQNALKMIPDHLVGDARGSIERCLTEMLLFAESWQTVSANAEETNASTNMAKLYLQTNERYRNQLNAYGMLDERGGDSTGTANKRLSEETGHTISDRDRAEERADEQGGWMAVALKSYGMEPEQERLRDIQMQKLLVRLKAGEFTTQEEYVTAFQQEIGGGATSRQYMAKLREQALGFWNAHQGSNEASAEASSYKSAGQKLGQIDGTVNRLDRATDRRDDLAKTREDNVGGYSDMSSSTKKELEESGKLSEQEVARLNMDQAASDKAYDNAQRFQTIAKRELDLARTLLQGADDDIAEGIDHHTRALQYIAQAKLHAGYVRDSKDAALQRGLSALDSEIVSVEQTLKANQEVYKQLVAKRQQLSALIDARVDKVEGYNPEKLKVPQPSVTMGGKKLENETYAKVQIDLTGPAFGVFWWLGGVEGQLSNTTSIDEKGLDNWTKASLKVTAGLKANLWLVEAGVKVSGFFEAQKKGVNGLIDTLVAGTEELGRWAYAYWYDLGSMSQEISTVMNTAQKVGEYNYTQLQNEAASVGSVAALGSAITTADGRMRTLHSGLQDSLASVYDNGPGETKIEDSAVETMADQAVPLDDILASFQNIQKAADLTEVQEALIADSKTLSGHISKTRNEAVSDVKAVDPGQNNPDVKFTAGVGIEGFVGSNLDAGPNLSFSAAAVWKISDGDGEGFDYSIQNEVSLTAKADFPMKNGANLTFQVKGVPKAEKDGGGWEIEVETDIPIKNTEHDVEGDEVMKVLQEICEEEAANVVVDPKTFVQSLPNKFGGGIVDWLSKRKDPTDPDNAFGLEKVSSTYIKVGGGFHIGSGGDVKKWAVKFGLFSKLEKKSKFGSAAYEAGNITTFTSEDAKKQAEDQKKLAQQKELEGKMMMSSGPESTTKQLSDGKPKDEED